MKVQSLAVRLLSVCCVLLVTELAPAHGASRGSSSSRSSSSRSSSSRSSSRSYSRSSGATTYSRMSTFVVTSFAWSVKYRAYRSGYYLSSQYWRQTHSSGLESSTPLCFNIMDPLPSEYNSSVRVPWIYRNQSTYGMFVCPLDRREDKIYCCGSDDAEYCCGFWDDGGRIAGVAVGVALGLAGIGLLCYVCITCAKVASAGSNAVATKPFSEAPPAYPGYDNYGADFSQAETPKDEPPPIYE